MFLDCNFYPSDFLTLLFCASRISGNTCWSMNTSHNPGHPSIHLDPWCGPPGLVKGLPSASIPLDWTWQKLNNKVCTVLNLSAATTQGLPWWLKGVTQCLAQLSARPSHPNDRNQASLPIHINFIFPFFLPQGGAVQDAWLITCDWHGAFHWPRELLTQSAELCLCACSEPALALAVS